MVELRHSLLDTPEGWEYFAQLDHDLLLGRERSLLAMQLYELAGRVAGDEDYRVE